MQLQPTAPLDRLARLANANVSNYSCADLSEFMRHAAELNDRGVNRTRLLDLSRLYARRLDQLGPEDFDRRLLIGA